MLDHMLLGEIYAQLALCNTIKRVLPADLQADLIFLQLAYDFLLRKHLVGCVFGREINRLSQHVIFFLRRSQVKLALVYKNPYPHRFTSRNRVHHIDLQSKPVHFVQLVIYI